MRILTVTTAIAVMLSPVAAAADIRPGDAVPSKAAAEQPMPRYDDDDCDDEALKGKSEEERRDDDCAITPLYAWDGPSVVLGMMSSGLFAWSIIKLLDWDRDRAISGG